MDDDEKSYSNLVAYTYLTETLPLHCASFMIGNDGEGYLNCVICLRALKLPSQINPPPPHTTLTNNFYRYISITVTLIVLRCFLLLVGQ